MAFKGIESEEPVFMTALISLTFDNIKFEVIQRKCKMKLEERLRTNGVTLKIQGTWDLYPRMIIKKLSCMRPHRRLL